MARSIASGDRLAGVALPWADRLGEPLPNNVGIQRALPLTLPDVNPVVVGFRPLIPTHPSHGEAWPGLVAEG